MPARLNRGAHRKRADGRAFLGAQWELVQGKDLLEVVNELCPNQLPEPRARRYFKQARRLRLRASVPARLHACAPARQL